MNLEKGYYIYEVFMIGFVLFLAGFNYGIENDYFSSLFFWISILILLIVIRFTKLRSKKK